MRRVFLSLGFTFLFCIFFSKSASAHYVWIDCDSQPGLRLCRSMKRIEQLGKYSCTGNACYELWRSEIAAMRRFSHTMNTEVPVGIKSPELVGRLAQEAAGAVCGQSAHGDCEWMKALFVARRDALAGLVELQKAAAMPVVKTCSLSYSCP